MFSLINAERLMPNYLTLFLAAEVRARATLCTTFIIIVDLVVIVL